MTPPKQRNAASPPDPAPLGAIARPRPEGHRPGTHLKDGEAALEAFEAPRDARFAMITRKWRTHRANLTPFFDYPPEIGKLMYTTNAIGALNAQLRKVTKKRGMFPNPEAVRKVLYLAITKASERWTRPVQDWPAALNHLAIVFPGRVPA